MPSAGELLRSERIKRNRSLTEIADQTRICRRYLEAIENDKIQELPGDFFYRSFLRQYSAALGLNADTTQQVLSCAAPVAEQPDPLPALTEAYQNAQTGMSDRWRPPTAVAVGLLIAVLAGGAALFAWWQRSQAPPELPSEVTVVPAESRTSPAPENDAAHASSSPVSVEALVSTPIPPPQAGQIAIELSAVEPAWVALTSEGKSVFRGTLDSGDTRQFAVQENSRLLTGNAGGLEVKMNGKSIGSIGSSGQVRTVVFAGGSPQVLRGRREDTSGQWLYENDN